MNYNKIKYLVNYYEKTLNTHKKGPKAVNWRNKKSQILRFKKICEIDNLRNKTILDVGCGLGHLVEFLEKEKILSHYKGLDISEDMIKQAIKKNKRKNVNFFQKDILKIKSKDIKVLKSDYVVNCGLFTVKDKIDAKEWWNYIQKMISNMFVLSKLGISFNLMKYNVDYKEEHLHYQSIDELVSFLEKNISKKIIIKNDYKLWEYTCFIYK